MKQLSACSFYSELIFNHEVGNLIKTSFRDDKAFKAREDTFNGLSLVIYATHFVAYYRVYFEHNNKYSLILSLSALKCFASI